MTTRMHHAVKRRKKARGLKLILGLAVCLGLFLGYKQLTAYAQNNSDKDIDTSGADVSSNGYKLLELDSTALAKGELVLVNKAYPYSFPENQELVSIYDDKKDCYFVRDMDVLLDKGVLGHLNDMMEAFYEKTGIHDVNVVAGHRTFEIQQELYNDSLAEHGAEHTAQYVAQPGCSEHHAGLAVDFSIFHIKDGTSAKFDGSGDYGWLNEHAWEYGFVQRYTKSKTTITHVAEEPWHFRYVGVPHAYYMTQNDLCLEEYISLLRQFPYDGAHLTIECAGRKYEVYFCTGMAAYVPEKGDYSISGNNDDGFIVTVNIS